MEQEDIGNKSLVLIKLHVPRNVALLATHNLPIRLNLLVSLIPPPPFGIHCHALNKYKNGGCTDVGSFHILPSGSDTASIKQLQC